MAKMNETTKCIQLLDYSKGWSDWRGGLKKVIESSHAYYKDETVQVLLKQLDEFLTKKVCTASGEELIIESLWEEAAPEERKTIATLLLKVAGNI
jgi:hypothetical protein